MTWQRVYGMTPNLVCEDGHYHWSPTPDAFMDRWCFTPTARGADGHPTLNGKCRKPLLPFVPQGAQR